MTARPALRKGLGVTWRPGCEEGAGGDGLGDWGLLRGRRAEEPKWHEEERV